MKNLMIFVVLVVLFAAVPAMAQSSSREFFDFFGAQRGDIVGAAQDTAGSAIKSEEVEDARDLSSMEILRAFVDKSFTVTPEEITAVFVAEVEIFSRERQGSYGGNYRYYYHRDPEAIVYVRVGRRDNGGLVVVGRGKSSNIRRAAEKAANDAAKKLQRLYKNQWDRVIFLP